MDKRKKLEKSVKNHEKFRAVCIIIAILAFSAMFLTCNINGIAEGSLQRDTTYQFAYETENREKGQTAGIYSIFMIIGLCSIISGSWAKKSQKGIEKNIHLLWRDSIDHTPGAETHQCNACFGPVFVDAERCRHCGASFVDEGVTIMPFIGVGF